MSFKSIRVGTFAAIFNRFVRLSHRLYVNIIYVYITRVILNEFVIQRSERKCAYCIRLLDKIRFRAKIRIKFESYRSDENMENYRLTFIITTYARCIVASSRNQWHAKTNAVFIKLQYSDGGYVTGRTTIR